MKNLILKEIPQDFVLTPIDGRILINGKILSEGFANKKVFSPCSQIDSNGKIEPIYLGTTPNVDTKIFAEAVESAKQAWAKGLGSWPCSRMEDRISAVSKFKDMMLSKREIICKLLMLEIAKTWADSQAEFDRTIAYINDTIEETKKLDRDNSGLKFAGGIMAQIRRAPLGVTLCMGPFNYPLNETFTTLIPALIMGNVLVVKIPRFGQILWDPLLEAFRDCFPPGVVNIVNGLGRDIISPSVQSGNLDVLAFIGSSHVANKIKLSHPQPHRFRGILGLDAKNPAVILENVDIENAVSECVKGSLSFNGQRCTAIKIIFVHEKIASKFESLFVKKIESLKVGMPWDENVFITPLPDPQKVEYLNGLIEDAINSGATFLNPRQNSQNEMNLFYPAVLTNISLESRVAKEEQFGPIVPIVRYKNLNDFEDYVVNSNYGMQASIFGSDPEQVGPLIDRLSNQVCRINLNAQCQRGPDVFPFTGRKASAEGTLSVYDALRSFSIRSMVAAKQDEAGKLLVRGILQEDTSQFLSSNIVL